MSFPEEKHRIADLEWSVNALQTYIAIVRAKIESMKAQLADVQELLIHDSNSLLTHEATLERCLRLLAEAQQGADTP